MGVACAGRLDILEFCRLCQDLDRGVVYHDSYQDRRGERLDRAVTELEWQILQKVDAKAATDSEAGRAAVLEKAFRSINLHGDRFLHEDEVRPNPCLHPARRLVGVRERIPLSAF